MIIILGVLIVCGSLKDMDLWYYEYNIISLGFCPLIRCASFVIGQYPCTGSLRNFIVKSWLSMSRARLSSSHIAILGYGYIDHRQRNKGLDFIFVGDGFV